MNTHYDNHANDIEYFDLHRPKIEVKKKSNFVDINDLSDIQIIERLDEVDIRLEELTELYNNTKHEGTFITLSKLHGFKSVIRANMRKRKLETNESLRLKIDELKKQFSDIGLNEVSKDQEKKINHLNLVNENLKNEIKTLKLNNNLQALSVSRTKVEQLTKELANVRSVLAENREAEKTKRHEINVLNEKYRYEYLKSFIKNHIGESEYAALSLKLDSM